MYETVESGHAPSRVGGGPVVLLATLAINIVASTFVLFWIGPKKILQWMFTIISEKPPWWVALAIPAVSSASIVFAVSLWISLTILSACLYGFYTGWLISFFSIVAGSMTSFAVGRIFLYDQIRPLVMESDWDRVKRMVFVVEQNKNSLSFLLLYRFTPAPLFLLNYIPSILNVEPLHFAIPVGIHAAWNTTGYSWLGSLVGEAVNALHEDFDISWGGYWKIIPLGVSFVSCIVLTWYARHKYNTEYAAVSCVMIPESTDT